MMIEIDSFNGKRKVNISLRVEIKDYGAILLSQVRKHERINLDFDWVNLGASLLVVTSWRVYTIPFSRDETFIFYEEAVGYFSAKLKYLTNGDANNIIKVT